MLHCPQCQSSEVHRTPVNASDFYYLLLLQRPYRCSECGRRFFRASWVGAAFLKASFQDRDDESAATHEIHATCKPYAVNRRGWVRFLCDFDAACEAPATESPESQVPGRINDISRGGALLVLDRALPEGTPLQLTLEDVPEEAPWYLNGHVVHCRQREDGDWAVGCRFEKRLTCEDLENLLLACR